MPSIFSVQNWHPFLRRKNVPRPPAPPGPRPGPRGPDPGPDELLGPDELCGAELEWLGALSWFSSGIFSPHSISLLRITRRIFEGVSFPESSLDIRDQKNKRR